VKLQGGLHELITREVEIECLPDDIPEHFTIEVGELMIGMSVRASDLVLGPNVKLLSPPEAVISHVVAMKAEEVAGARGGGRGCDHGRPQPSRKSSRRVRRKRGRCPGRREEAEEKRSSGQWSVVSGQLEWPVVSGQWPARWSVSYCGSWESRRGIRADAA
jgi:hypothetical protein